jgi:hypothetical protein
MMYQRYDHRKKSPAFWPISDTYNSILVIPTTMQLIPQLIKDAQILLRNPNEKKLRYKKTIPYQSRYGDQKHIFVSLPEMMM